MRDLVKRTARLENASVIATKVNVGSLLVKILYKLKCTSVYSYKPHNFFLIPSHFVVCVIMR